MGLILGNRAGLSGDPIGLLQFDAPEKGSWRNKFDAHALALLGIVAEIDDSAFLLFLSRGIDEYEQRAYLQILLGVEQSAMSADHDRFADMPKTPALMILARELHANSHEPSGTAPFSFVGDLGHGSYMVG
jgi:hypothetical protein